MLLWVFPKVFIYVMLVRIRPSFHPMLRSKVDTRIRNITSKLSLVYYSLGFGLAHSQTLRLELACFS